MHANDDRVRPGPNLTVVVPAFDAAHVIASTVRTLHAELGDATEIVVVDDGSTDGTAAAARDAGADAVIVHACNRGKGAAVRSGFAAARGRTVAFTDADLSYDPAQVGRVVAAVDAGADVAIGTRAHAASLTLEDPRPLRRLASRPFNALTRLALGHTYADTQCGLKAFSAEAAHQLAVEARIDGFAFDVELLHLAERHKMTVVEVPVSVTHAPERSSVRLAVHVPQMMRDLLRIRRYERRGSYGPRSATGAPDPAPNP